MVIIFIPLSIRVDIFLSGVCSIHRPLFSIEDSSTILRLFELLAFTCKTSHKTIQTIVEQIRIHRLKIIRCIFLYRFMILNRLLSTNKSKLLLIHHFRDDTIFILSSSGNLSGLT